MRSRSYGILLACLFGVSVAKLGCSLFLDTDGLSAPPTAPVVDGSTDAQPQPPATTPGPTDAGADAIADAAPDGPFCKQHPGATFCADFDESDDPLFGWSAPLLDGTESATVLDVDGGPHERFLVSSVGSSASSAQSARLYRSLPTVPSSLHVEADIFLCAVAAGVHEFFKIEYSAASIHAVNVGYEIGLILTVDNGAGHLLDQRYALDGAVTGDDFPIAPLWPFEKWFHLELDANLSASGDGKLRLVIDHAAQPSLDVSNVTTLTPSASAVRLIAGAYQVARQTGCLDRFDNVLVETTP